MNDRVRRAYGLSPDWQQEKLPIYYAGLDLGQVSDPSVLSILEVEHTQHGKEIEPRKRELNLRYLERFPLHTSYPSIVTSVMKRMKALLPMGSLVVLLVDGTGVGRAVVDLFRDAKHEDVALAPITFTSGNQVTPGDGSNELHIPVRDLVGSAQIALQTKRLKWPKDMQWTKELVKELRAFKVKITLSKLGIPHDSYEAWREGDHDDIVFAVAMACWAAADAGHSIYGGKSEWGPSLYNRARLAYSVLWYNRV